MENAQKKLALYEYEQILLGNQINFKVSFERTGSTENKKKIVSFIWRYAIEDILKWTPEQALELLNTKLIKSLHLHKAMEEIEIRIEEKRKYNIREVLNVVYPDKISYSFTDEAISEFKRLNDLDEYETDTSTKRFQSNYFTGSDGQKRAAIIFKYALNLSFGDKSVYEQYCFFADTSEAKKWMKNNKISGIMSSYYPEPIACLHASLPIEQQNEVYYLNEYFKNNTRMTELNNLMSKVLLAEKLQKIQKQQNKKEEVFINAIDLSSGFTDTDIQN